MEKYDIFIEDFKEISPQFIQIYLSSIGWKKSLSTPQYDAYLKAGKEVYVPTDCTFKDYAYRIEDLVNDVSKVEELAPMDIIANITSNAAIDIFEYKYKPFDGEIGVIPIDSMKNILDSNTDMTLFAFKDVIEYKSYHANKRSGDGRKIIDSLRLGLTRPGSYIVRIMYPDDHNIQTSLFGDRILGEEKMLLRNVCAQMEHSINTILESTIDGKDTLDVKEMISYNFVASMLPLDMNTGTVDVKRIAVINPSTDNPVTMCISKKIMHNVRIIEENMRPKEMDEELEFMGFFSNAMEVDGNSEDDTFESQFKLKFVSARFDEPQTAKIKLKDDDRKLAFECMTERKSVKLKGKLIGTGRSKCIIDVDDLRKIE